MKQPDQVAFVLFGVPIYFAPNGTVRLKDIQDAYVAETGADAEAARFKNYARTDKAQELIEFLDGLDGDDRYWGDYAPITSPRGNRGGLYAIKELAHAYAMWLDVRYAFHVLRAFDQLVAGDLFGAKKTANKVAQRFVQESYKARYERLTALGIDYKRYMAVVLADVLGFAPREDLMEFLDTITSQCPTSAAVLNEILCGAELAALHEGELDESISNALELYQDDPRIGTLKDFVNNFNA